MKTTYGECEYCGAPLVPYWFIEEEYKRIGNYEVKTGRTRRAVSHLSCENCGKEYCVDDTFDGPWR